jgi:hypothetical protein
LLSRKEEAPAGLVRLLPSFDEYLLGWKDRGFAVTPENWKRINRGGGWLHPVVLVNGRAVGVWKAEREKKRLTIGVEPFSKLAPTARKDVTQEAADVGRFLGTDIEVAI